MAQGLTSNSDGLTTRQLAAPANGPAPDTSGPVGTISGTNFAAQTANTLFAGPGSGGAAKPTFRAMVTSDLGTTLTPQFARVGVGVAADATQLLRVAGGVWGTGNVNAFGNASAPNTAIPGPGSSSNIQFYLETEGDATTTGGIGAFHYGPNGAIFRQGGASGSTKAGAASTIADRVIGGLAAHGYVSAADGGTGWVASAKWFTRLGTDGTWSTSNNGTYCRWEGTPNGSTTRSEWMRLYRGNLLIGGTSDTGLTGAGGMRIFSTTEATASGGSAIVDGGLLVKKALFVNSTTATTSGTTGALVCAGGVGVAGKVFVADTTEATSSAGAIVTSGGISAVKKVFASSFGVGANQVVGARDTGWTAFTGSATNKATAYDTATITLPQLAERVRALQEALTTHGLLGV